MYRNNDISLSLFNCYKAYRKELEGLGMRKSDWRNSDLMEFFIQTMWEESDPDNKWDDRSWLDLNYDQWLKLDRMYSQLGR